MTQPLDISLNNVGPKAKYREDYQSPTHTIVTIDLTFDLHDSETLVTAISSVIQQKDETTLVLDGEGILLQSILVDGLEWEHYSVTDTHLTLTQLPHSFELTIVTQINPAANSALEGLYKSGGAFCTQCEAEGFRRITYYLDRPDVLAKYTTTIVANKKQYPFLLSNGNRVDQGELGDDRHWVKWQDPHLKPAYLFALVAGDFDRLSDHYITRSGRKVDLEIFVDKGNLDRAHHAMASLINAMKWDEERFDLEYDLDIYMIVAVDFFNMGAMENKGLNIFNSKYVLANDQTATDNDYLGIEAVIGHEYFHNWTGNRITCRDWFQLSLKEGLTVFRDQEFSSDLGSRSVNRINNVRVIRGPQFAEDASPMSHPIRPEKVIEMNNFYTLTVYEKGSEVIRMMHTLLGEKAFQKGMKLYISRHDGSAATCDDFIQAMEDASNIDLTQFHLWYSQSGTPTLTVSSQYDALMQRYHLTVEQLTEPTQDQAQKQPLHIPFDIELYNQQGDVIELRCNGEAVHHVLNITEAKQTFIFDQISEQPIPSLLREFSAPVKLKYDYSDQELAFLIKHARNEFSRWDAGQMLLAKYIRHHIEQVEINPDHLIILPETVIDALRDVLLNKDLDDAFIAEMLSFPSHSEVSGWYKRINVDVIDRVLTTLKQYLSHQLEDELLAIYHESKQEHYQITHQAIGLRSLRNTCLSYLAYSDFGDKIVSTQYQNANNMTDTIAAMTAANAAQLPCRETLMNHYSDKWQHDGLIMDKWFTLQGTNPAANALEQIKVVMGHPAFSLNNPNRTRSLLGAFFSMNPVGFHAKSGEGYRFAGEILEQLNNLNPQVASRLIDPLLKYRFYDEERQNLMKVELEKLKSRDDLAKDLYEKVHKALEM